MFNTPDRFEGVGMAMRGLSDELQEHGYWGSMRDRLPLSQTDAMSSSGSRAIVAGAPLSGHRVQVAGHQNIAMIRPGQEWTDTAGTERWAESHPTHVANFGGFMR